ncbi:MAG: MBL fold metallo-hydrolase [Firmicutes bacterium]|nr:MBL fold metallo-hydrolase [Bacillota bacterium]
MRIVILMENTSNGICECEHGLSVYVETDHHKLLVDTGASSKTWENAQKLNIDISKVDTLILSHGHYDHAGGILSFSSLNPNADIYLHKKAGGAYYSLRKEGYTYIGINPRIMGLSNLHYIDKDIALDEEISIFTKVTEREKWPTSNLRIRELVNGEYIQDSFAHEQYVVITCDGKSILISGCAHNGIVNIMHRYYSLYQTYPDIVISGFHMKQKKPYSQEEIDLIQSIGYELKETGTLFYTGHCTGEEAFLILKDIMGEGLIDIHAGDFIL